MCEQERLSLGQDQHPICGADCLLHIMSNKRPVSKLHSGRASRRLKRNDLGELLTRSGATVVLCDHSAPRKAPSGEREFSLRCKGAKSKPGEDCSLERGITNNGKAAIFDLRGNGC